jgi:hypothetical protein
VHLDKPTHHYEYNRAVNVASNKEIMEKLELVGFEIDPNKPRGKEAGGPVTGDSSTGRSQTKVSGTPTTGTVATRASARLNRNPAINGIPLSTSDNPASVSNVSLPAKEFSLNIPTSVANTNYTSNLPAVPSSPSVSNGNPDNPSVNSSGWPDWLMSAYTFLGSKDLGVLWRELLFSWTELERAYKFVSPGGPVRSSALSQSPT